MVLAMKNLPIILTALSMIGISYAQSPVTSNTQVMMQQANKIEVELDSLETQIQALLEQTKTMPSESVRQPSKQVDPQAASSSLFTPGGQPRQPKENKAEVKTATSSKDSNHDNPYKDSDSNADQNPNANDSSDSTSSSANSSSYNSSSYDNNSWNNNNYPPYYPPSPSSTSLSANILAKTYPYQYTLSPKSADPINPLISVKDAQTLTLQFTGNSRTYTEISFCRSNFTNCSAAQQISSNTYIITASNKSTINERIGYLPALIGDEEYWVGAIYFMMKSGTTQYKYQFTFPVGGNSNIVCTNDGDNKACQIKQSVKIPISQIKD